MGWTQIFVKGQPKDYQGDRSLEDMVEFVNDNAGTARRADGTVDTAYGRLPEVDKVLADWVRGGTFEPGSYTRGLYQRGVE